jgi:hypothetical protein
LLDFRRVTEQEPPDSHPHIVAATLGLEGLGRLASFEVSAFEGSVMSEPQPGDVIVRGPMGGGFMVLDAVTRRALAGPLSYKQAVADARVRGSGRVWEEHTDERGRPLGPPARLALA